MRCYDSSHPLAGFVSPNLLHVLKRQVGLESSCSVAKAVKSPEGKVDQKAGPAAGV